ncbi:MAG: hypothetical protein D6798_05355 [Deltaproteobacteria bacterium]|nr:MAG: hypothetical protein D6798_05355 [Deltaproteobacteria bacterium]
MAGSSYAHRRWNRSGTTDADQPAFAPDRGLSGDIGNQARLERIAGQQGAGLAPDPSLRPVARPERQESGSLAPETSPRPRERPERETFVDEFAVEAAAQAVLAVVPDQFMPEAEANVARILSRCAWEFIENPHQVAYILATAHWESRFGHPKYSRSESLVEDHNAYRQRGDGSWSARNHVTTARAGAPRYSHGDSRESLDLDYWDDAYGGRLGNQRGTSDASHFRGRGFVQLTGRSNYAEMSRRLTDEGFTYFLDGVTWGRPETPIDLETHYDHVNRSPELAAKILAYGMMEGTFTGQDLPRYVNDRRTNYTGARAVINGTDQAAEVAAIARRYERVLNDAWPRVFWRSFDPPR